MTKKEIEKHIEFVKLNGEHLYTYKKLKYNRTTKRLYNNKVEICRCFSKRDFINYIYNEQKKGCTNKGGY